MNYHFQAKSVTRGSALMAYVDLCGTRAIYDTLPLEEQKNRISTFVATAWGELDNVFGDKKTDFYVHMFADSLVVAQRMDSDPTDSINKLVNWLLSVQRELLQNSESSRMPIVSRGLVKRGPYFGMIFEQIGSNLDDMFSNFSLVGGRTVIEMDVALRKLPAGTYIDEKLVSEFDDQNRLVQVDGGLLCFAKPPDGFYSLHKIFENITFDDWIARLINQVNDDEAFKKKIQPWADAIQNRLNLIKRG